MKTEAHTSEELDLLNSSTPALLLYFYNDSCAPCAALRPKIEELLNESFPLMKHTYINAALNPAIAASHGVFSSPAIIVFFDGKETFRVSSNISIRELAAKIKRYYNLIFE